VDGYYRRGLFTCQESSCKKVKRQQVLKNHEISASGIPALRTLSLYRRGKTFAEIYPDKQENIREKIRLARARQTGTAQDPRRGKTHSLQSKSKMSQSKLDFIKNTTEAKYRSTITGELVSWREFLSHSRKHALTSDTKKYVSPLTGENVNLREYYRDVAAKRFIEEPHMSRGCYSTGCIKNWHTGLLERYDSSYECCYMQHLNAKGAFWKKNTRELSLEYSHSSTAGKKKLYFPDFLIYRDSLLTQVLEIVEVKPKAIFTRVAVVGHKFSVLKEYCKSIGAEAKLVTEDDLDMNLVKDIQNEAKRNKEKKSAGDASILSDCG
jgi:hypothetical protein